jgi:hypothetical protein
LETRGDKAAINPLLGGGKRLPEALAGMRALAANASPL